MTEEAAYRFQTLSAHDDGGGGGGSAVVAAPDDPPEWISDSSAISTVTDDGEGRFHAGNLALKCVLLLIWAYAGLRVYEAYRLVQLLQSMQRRLEALGPALDTTFAVDEQKGDPIIGWLIAILAYSLAITLALFAALFYVMFAYLLQSSCSKNGQSQQSLSAKRIKFMLRTMGTLLFYFVLLPEAIGVLVLSGMITATGKLVDKRVRIGAVSLDKVLTIGHSFGCNGTESASCWMPDEANMTRVSRQLYLPMRQHLQQSHLPEAFSQMALIIVAFLVTHLIRGRGTWEVDHRQLLEQTAFLRLAEQRRSPGLVINSQNPIRLDMWRRKKNL